MKRLRVLHVEDSEADVKLVRRALGHDFELAVTHVSDREALVRALAEPCDVVLCDWEIPGFGGAAALEVVRELDLELPFIIVSGTITATSAVAAMRAGAHDYVLKDGLARLAPAIERELREHVVRRERRHVQAELRAQSEALRRAEDRLRSTQKLEALGSLAGGVAHDFNNVLSVILSWAELILDETPADGSDREPLEQIVEAARRGAGLTRQLLAFSRTRATSAEIVDLDSLVLRLEQMLRRLLPADVTLVVVTSGTDSRIVASASHLEQVIMNLVLNARDALPRGGEIQVGVCHHSVSAAEAAALELACGAYVVLTVADNGVGMDAGTQARIFEPFFTTKPRGQGTGLGLSTVFGVVAQCGGRVDVTSTVGLGTTFTVHLPRTLVSASEPTAVAPITAVAGTETILVVEDDEQVRRLTCNLLRRHGYRVLEAANAGEALLGIEHCGTVDLLLTDIELPRWSGFQLARRLRAAHPELRVLCMTGSAQTDPAAFRVLQKPLTPMALLGEVRAALDGR